MEKIIVEESPPLSGRVRVSGAKNSVLPILAASLLSTEKCVLEDVPNLKDVEVLTELLVLSLIHIFLPSALSLRTMAIRSALGAASS